MSLYRKACAGSRLGLFTLTILSLLLGAFLFAPPASAEEPLRVVFIAYQNPDQLLEDVGPVTEYLESQLGTSVKAFTATDYAGVVEALRNQRADVGFMGPLQYVLAHQQAGAVPLLGEVYSGGASYHSRIFVRKDSGIRTEADLKGRTVAFTDPISSSGYLYPLEIFRDAGLIRQRDDAESFFGRIYFAGGDEQALRAVLNGFVDAAGIGQYSFSLLRPEERDQVRWIAESKPIPSHCVVVRKGLPAARVERLKQALLALEGGPQKHLLRSLYNVDGYVEVDHQTYAEVEKLARDHGFLPAGGR
ncbi:MAG: phosphate/phosphite/phosphonate ABC transporter substrate-binding protein [Acidobacteriota bacterium]|nr:phosphate/phosphite/phosphonate ABC transporter substrate-binding protein [Acidobacteriota bacterium]